MTKGARRLPRLLVRLRAAARGCGEVLGFLKAGAVAVIGLCLGQWPEFEARREQPPKSGQPARSKTIAPYPVND